MTAAPWQGAQLDACFERARGVLRAGESLWRPAAFQHLRLPWERERPGLARRLRALSLAEAEAAAENDTALRELLCDDVPGFATSRNGLALPPLPAAPLAALPEAVGVPGRKWRQLQAFAAQVPAGAATLLEWCAGKSHLGRLLARLQGRDVLALEWDARLVEAGAQLARREGLAVAFECVDVLQPAASRLLRAEHDVVALHACGELHLQLLRDCAQRRPRTLTLAPCCYQLIPGEQYAPLSAAAQRDDPRLTRHDLHTAVRDSVTSAPRVQQQRRALQAWRLGFDLWQREARGIDAYLPTPSLSPGVLRDGFASFCADLAARNGLPVPPAAQFAAYERAGWERLREVAALDLARIAFRRPLELWLVLDRALYLRQHGYDVELGTFCERALTPRNIVLRARHHDPR